jgi:hypothetical protein
VTMNVADLEKLVRNVGAVDADAAAVPTPDLLRRLFLALRSLDPAVRDDFAVYTLTRWIVIERRVAPAGLGQLHGWASSDEGILRDLGGTDSASVFGRSFALVLLSALHAVDNEAPFLDHDGWQRTRDALAAYGAAELDVRSFVEGCGWVHTIAHLSDVCDELARSSRCDVSSARILLTALVGLVGRRTDVFTGEEDDRLSLCLHTFITSAGLGRHEVVAAIRGAAEADEIARINWRSTARALALRIAEPTDEIGTLAAELTLM